MLKKSNTPVNPIQMRKEALNESIRQARDFLQASVRSALAYSQLLSILPEESKEYQVAKDELDEAKYNVAVQISTYEKYRKELNEFCRVNNIRSVEWVDGYEIATFAIEK